MSQRMRAASTDARRDIYRRAIAHWKMEDEARSATDVNRTFPDRGQTLPRYFLRGHHWTCEMIDRDTRSRKVIRRRVGRAEHEEIDGVILQFNRERFDEPEHE